MKKYNFPVMIYETNENGLIEKIGETKTIMYKCLICNTFTKEWDENFDDAKKSEIISEVDKHHNDYIIPDELSNNL